MQGCLVQLPLRKGPVARVLLPEPLHCTVLYCTVLYCMWCLSNLCLSFLELFQEKEAEMEGEGVGVDQHMVSRYYQVFR